MGVGTGAWVGSTSGDGASLESGASEGDPDEQPTANRIVTAIMQRAVGRVEDSGMWVLFYMEGLGCRTVYVMSVLTYQIAVFRCQAASEYVI